MAAAPKFGQEVVHLYPAHQVFDPSIPERVVHFLKQAYDTMHAPSASIVVAAAAVDAMLKSIGYKDGNLYKRIEKAASDHLITNGMKEWAHHIRLEANEERHADENAPMPTTEDVKQCLDFAMALAEFLFVLPDRVRKGLSQQSS
jgi:hypothetical protein